MKERESRQSTSNSVMLDMALGAAGGLFGAIFGFFLFFIIAKQGFYAIALPGALVGLGCGCLSGRKSLSLGIACAMLGILIGIITEWRFAPFVKDKSLSFFILHLHELTRVTQILILVGSFLAFWFGRGREEGVWPRCSAGSRCVADVAEGVCAERKAVHRNEKESRTHH